MAARNIFTFPQQTTWALHYRFSVSPRRSIKLVLRGGFPEEFADTEVASLHLLNHEPLSGEPICEFPSPSH